MSPTVCQCVIFLLFVTGTSCLTVIGWWQSLDPATPITGGRADTAALLHNHIDVSLHDLSDLTNLRAESHSHSVYNMWFSCVKCVKHRGRVLSMSNVCMNCVKSVNSLLNVDQFLLCVCQVCMKCKLSMYKAYVKGILCIIICYVYVAYYLCCVEQQVSPIHTDFICAWQRRSKKHNVLIRKRLQRSRLPSLIHWHTLSTHT